MTKKTNPFKDLDPRDFFFWIDIEEGDVEEVDEEGFHQHQQDWDGPRPQDFDGGRLEHVDADEEQEPDCRMKGGDGGTTFINPMAVGAFDRQEGGSHYKNYAIQPLEFIMANKLDACQANVVKYVVRFREKGGMEDLIKARHYIDLLIAHEYGESG